MSKKVLLTISLLVSGRAETTEKCLNSLQKILQSIDSELILVDTGCSEEMHQKLLRYTDQVIPFTWCDDFSKARNAGLERALGEWFLFLDDDEWFEDVTPILDFFQSGEYKEYHQAVYRVRNYSNYEGTDYSDMWVSRMIRLEPGTHFEGYVHESLVPAVGKCKKIEAYVHHYGYVFPSEEARRAHFERNERILNKLMQEEPNNLHWRLQFLQEYYSIKDGTRLRQAAESALALIAEIDKAFINECRGAFYTGVLLGSYLEGDYEAVERCCREFMEDDRNSDQGVCSLCVIGATAAKQCDEKELLAWYCKTYFHHLKEHQETVRDEQEQIIAESIVLVSDAVCEDQQLEMHLLWAWALAGLARSEEFPEDQQRKLTAYVQRMMDGNAGFLFLPERIWDIAAGHVFPLENMLLTLPMSQWMAAVMLLQAKNNVSEWRTVQEHLALIRTRDDIRYDYMDMHEANIIILGDVSEKSYEDMCRLLQYYAQSNLSFARKVYTQRAFDDMQILPESCRGAVWMERVFDCEEQDWNGKLENLKKSAKEWPALGEAIKHFAGLIGKEQERMTAQAASAHEQLRAMAEQVKKQVRDLMDAGMNAEALSIVRQLQAMLPEDKGLAELERELSMR